MRNFPKENQYKPSNLFDRVYLVIIILIACSVALAIMPRAFNYVFIKLVIAQFLLIVLFVIWLYQILEKEEISIYKDPAYIPLGFLLVWCVISLFYSSFMYASVRELERLFTCFFLYFVVLNLVKKEKDLLSVVIVIIILFIGLSLQGLFEYLKNKDPVIISTFGNPNFFSAYLVLVLPLMILVGIYNFLRKNFFISSLVFILSAGVIFLIYILRCRGAWIALGIAFIFLVVLFVTKALNPQRKLPVLIVSMFLILIILGAISLLLIQKVPSIKTYVNNDITTGTTGIRIKIWQGTLRMIQARPFIGWGMGTFIIIYPNFRIPEYFLNPYSVNATDHAHNEILEFTSELGIIGLGLFLWFLGIIFLRGIRIFYNNRQLNFINIIHTGLLAGVIALFLENLTDVNLRLEASVLYLYLFLGLISAGCKLFETQKEEIFFEKAFFNKKGLVLLIVPIAILLGVGYTNETLKLMRASIHLKSAITLRDQKRWGEAIEQYHKAIYWDHYNWKAYYRLAYAYAETNKIDEALATYLQLKAIAPDYADIHYNLGSLYLKMGKWEDAKKELQRSIELNPYEPKTLCNLGAIYMQLGESENASNEYKLAILVQDQKKKLEPNLANFGGGYIGLSDIYYSQNRWEEASENYQKAIQLGEKNVRILVKLGNCYLNMQDFKKAKQVYEEALKQDSSLSQVKESVKQLDKIIESGKNGSE